MARIRETYVDIKSQLRSINSSDVDELQISVFHVTNGGPFGDLIRKLHETIYVKPHIQVENTFCILYIEHKGLNHHLRFNTVDGWHIDIRRNKRYK